jgi:hypothetical protein
MAFFTIGVIGSRESSIVNSVNVYPSRLSAIILSNVVILFLALVCLGLVSIRITTFLSLPFLFLFLLLIINFNYFLSKISKGNFLLINFINLIFNFQL